MKKVLMFCSYALHDKSESRYLSICLPEDGPEIGPKHVVSNNRTLLIFGGYADDIIELCRQHDCWHNDNS
jgi:hypothetical protein